MIFIFLALATLVLSGCLSATTQHFNTGETLPHGETRATFGLAAMPLTTCYDSPTRDAEGYMICDQAQVQTIPQPSYTWSLGVREKWGPFTGVEIGWMAEALGTIDFNVKLGLPGLVASPKWHHAAMTGWGMGNWADNTLFLEYAISHRTTERILFYTNLRGSLVATSIIDLELSEIEADGKQSVFQSHQRWLLQNTWGVRFGPFTVPILPKTYDFNIHMGTPKLMWPGGTPSPRLDASGYPALYYALGMGLSW